MHSDRVTYRMFLKRMGFAYCAFAATGKAAIGFTDRHNRHKK